MTSRTATYLAASLVLLTLVLAIGAAHFEVREFVHDIGTPPFHTVQLPPVRDSVEAMEGHLHRIAGHNWLRELVPNEGGALWIGVLVLIAAGFDARGWSRRFGDLILAQATAWLLFGSLDIFEQTEEPAFLGWIRLIFELIALATAIVWARTFWLQRRPYREAWTPAASSTSLATVAVAVVVLNLFAIFIETPDDSSFFANLGGQRLRERGRLPYGDPMLTGTAGAAYPPLLYVLHAGAQAAIGEPLNDPVEERPRLGARSTYVEPGRAATQMVLAVSHLLGLAAMWIVGQRMMGDAGAWAGVALYAGSSYLIDIGGSRESTGGLPFVSHIVPAAATLIAFAALHRAGASGALLAIATGLGFYPVFFLPIWSAWQWRRGTRELAAFAAGFVLVSALVGWWVLWSSEPAPGLSLVGTIVRDTLGHHSDPAGYGLSLYGLWGQQTGMLGVLGHPLVGASAWSTPFFVIFACSLLLSAWFAWRADQPRLALLTAGAAIGANLWKIHATATYVAWYYPFLVLGLLALSPEPQAKERTEPGST